MKKERTETTVPRMAAFDNMEKDGVIGKRRLTAARLFGLTAESFLPDSHGRLPLEDVSLGFCRTDPRYANLYALWQETEARLASYMTDGEEAAMPVLLGGDPALSTLFDTVNCCHSIKKQWEEAPLVVIGEKVRQTKTLSKRLLTYLEQGGQVLFWNTYPKDTCLNRLLFSGKEPQTLPADTYIKADTVSGGALWYACGEQKEKGLLEAILRQISLPVFVENKEEDPCRIRYGARKTNRHTVYLFYNADEEKRADQYVRLPFSAPIWAMDPKSGGIWKPEQQRYERETWFKLWLAPEESLLYFTDKPDGEKLLLAQDTFSRRRWDNLAGEHYISAYGAMPTFCPTPNHVAWAKEVHLKEGQIVVTLTRQTGSFSFLLGDNAHLTWDGDTVAYCIGGKEVLRRKWCFGSIPIRVHIKLSDAFLYVTADGKRPIKVPSPQEGRIGMVADGVWHINSLYVTESLPPVCAR